MENKVAAELRRFAHHTGFRNLQDSSQMARKYLAVHMRMIHPSLVYPFVGADYELESIKLGEASIICFFPSALQILMRLPIIGVKSEGRVTFIAIEALLK